MPSNETLNRRAKAADLIEAYDRSLALCGHLSHGTELVSMLRRAPDHWWRRLAKQAGVLPPSNPADRELGVSLETRRAVIDAYETRTAAILSAEITARNVELDRARDHLEAARSYGSAAVRVATRRVRAAEQRLQAGYQGAVGLRGAL